MRPATFMSSRSSAFPFSILLVVIASDLAGATFLSLRANASEKISASPMLLTVSTAQNWVSQTSPEKVSPSPAVTPEPKQVPPAPAPDEAETPTESSAGELAGPSAGENERVTIPRSSAIIVSFPAELTLDPKRQHNFPITLSLLQPIVDTEGQIVAPAKSLVSAQLKAMKGGDLIEVVAMVVGGRVIPIHAMGTLVPAQNKPEDVANPAVGSPSRLNNVMTSLQSSSVLTDYSSNNNRISVLDAINLGLSLGAGLTTPVPKVPPSFTSITQGSVYILNLETSLTIPKRLVETGVQIRESLGEEGTIPTAQ